MITSTTRKSIVFIATFGAAAGLLAACTSPTSDTDASGTAPVQQTSGAPALPDGPVDAGTYSVKTLDSVFDGDYRITMEVPSGYEGADGFIVGAPGKGQNGITNWIVGSVYGEACHWSGTLPIEPVASTVDGLVGALTSQKGRQFSTPTVADVDGFTGEYVEMRTPPGLNLAKCDERQFRAWTDTEDGARWTEPGQRDLLWIVDVGGTPLVVDVALGPDASRKDRAERTRMVESIQIEAL